MHAAPDPLLAFLSPDDFVDQGDTIDGLGPPPYEVVAPIDLLLPGPSKRSRLTDEAKASLMQAIQQHQWTTAREAYGWLWNECGVRVSYKTVWSFLNTQGLFVGSTLGSRRLKPN